MVLGGHAVSCGSASRAPSSDYAPGDGRLCVCAYRGALQRRVYQPAGGSRRLIEAAGASGGERVWCFPMDADFDTDLESRSPISCNVRPTARQGPHPGGAIPEPVRAQGHRLAAPRSSRPARRTAGSPTSPRRSPDSACATPSIWCAAGGRRRHRALRRRANEHLDAATPRRLARAPARRHRTRRRREIHRGAIRPEPS